MSSVDDALKASYVRERCEHLCRRLPGVDVEAVVLLEKESFGVILSLREGLDWNSAEVRSVVAEIEKLWNVRGVYVQLAGS